MSLVKVFDVPAKLVGKVPVLGKYVKPVVVPLLFGAGGALVLGALTKATLRFMPEQIQPFAYTTAGVLGSVGLAIAIAGPGAFSIDAVMGLEDVFDGWIGAALVGGGVLAAAVQMAVFFRPREVVET